MAGKSDEGPWLFDGREVLKDIARKKPGRECLKKLARRKRRLDGERERAYQALVEATLPLADLIQAACGRSAYMFTDAVLDTLGARADPEDYGKKVGQRPPPKSPAQDERSTQLYAELRADARRLRPRFRKMSQEEEACKKALAALVAPGDRKKYRKWYAVTRGLDQDLWLQTLYSELDNWRGKPARRR